MLADNLQLIFLSTEPFEYSTWIVVFIIAIQAAALSIFFFGREFQNLSNFNNNFLIFKSGFHQTLSTWHSDHHRVLKLEMPFNNAFVFTVY